MEQTGQLLLLLAGQEADLHKYRVTTLRFAGHSTITAMRLFTRVELGRRQPHLLAPMALKVFPAHLHRLVWQLVDLGRGQEARISMLVLNGRHRLRRQLCPGVIQ